MGVVVNDDGIVCCMRGERRFITFLCKRFPVDTPLLVHTDLVLLLLYDIDALWYDRLVITLLMAWHRCCNSETDRNESIINLIRRY